MCYPNFYSFVNKNLKAESGKVNFIPFFINNRIFDINL